QDEDHEGDNNFSYEDVSPGYVRRESPTDQWSKGDGYRPGCRNRPIRARAALGREVDSDQGHDGGHDQRGANTFQERPSEYQDAEVRCQSCSKRAGCVDDAADRESASTSNNGPDLPPVSIRVAI